VNIQWVPGTHWTLSYQLPSVNCVGQENKLNNKLPFELPVLGEWNEYKHGYENVDLGFITLSQKEAAQMEIDTREQSGSAKWKVERAKRITASQFGQVCKCKAEVTEKFLNELFQGKSIQTPAMKYGLSNESRAATEYIDHEQAEGKKLYKSGLVVNPAFSWLGASPDGVVCDPSSEVSVQWIR